MTAYYRLERPSCMDLITTFVDYHSIAVIKPDCAGSLLRRDQRMAPPLVCVWQLYW